MKTEKSESVLLIYMLNVMNIRNLKHGLILKKFHTVIKFNQKAWLKLYIDLNSNLKKSKKRKMWENIEILNL